MSQLSEGDDDDDFLTGVPMKATGDEDILTLADLAVDSGKQSDKKKESSDSGSHGNLLDKVVLLDHPMSKLRSQQ